MKKLLLIPLISLSFFACSKPTGEPKEGQPQQPLQSRQTAPSQDRIFNVVPTYGPNLSSEIFNSPSSQPLGKQGKDDIYINAAKHSGLMEQEAKTLFSAEIDKAIRTDINTPQYQAEYKLVQGWADKVKADYATETKQLQSAFMSDVLKDLSLSATSAEFKQKLDVAAAAHSSAVNETARQFVMLFKLVAGVQSTGADAAIAMRKEAAKHNIADDQLPSEMQKEVLAHATASAHKIYDIKHKLVLSNIKPNDRSQSADLRRQINAAFAELDNNTSGILKSYKEKFDQKIQASK